MNPHTVFHSGFSILHSHQTKGKECQTKGKEYLGINLPKEMKDLYTENCKTLEKEIKQEIDKWKDIHVQGLEDLLYENVHTTQSDL